MRVTTENTKKTAETETKNASVKKADEQSTESTRKKAEKLSGNAAARNYTYILKCGDGSLYTGWTNDIAARLEQHRSGKGAKYTRGRGPLELVYLEVHDTKSEAMSREARIKRFTKREKLNLLGTEEWRLELTGTELEETDKKLPLGAVFYLLRSGYRETISLQIGFPIEENFCSYSVMTFP